MVQVTSYPFPYTYQRKPINLDTLCCQNELHYYLYQKGLQKNPPLTLITFNNPKTCIGQIDVSGISMATAGGGRPLDILIAKAQAVFLAERGVVIPESSVPKYKESLINGYLLDSCVSLAATASQQGTTYMLVTKSSEVISALQTRLAPDHKKRGIQHFGSQYTTTNSQMKANLFHTIKLQVEQDGIHLSKQKLSARSVRQLLPYYSVRNYASRLFNILSHRTALIVYRDDTGVQSIQTSLISEVVADLFGTTPTSIECAKRMDWVNPLSLGILKLPDLVNRQWVDVPLLGIEQLKIN